MSKFIILEVFSNAYSISRVFKDIYTELSKLVTGSNVGVLEGDAENIVDFIVGSLRKLTSTIEVKVSIYNNIDINFRLIQYNSHSLSRFVSFVGGKRSV